MTLVSSQSAAKSAIQAISTSVFRRSVSTARPHAARPGMLGAPRAAIPLSSNFRGRRANGAGRQAEPDFLDGPEGRVHSPHLRDRYRYPLAIACTQVFRSLLFEVGATDGATFATIVTGIIAVTSPAGTPMATLRRLTPKIQANSVCEQAWRAAREEPNVDPSRAQR